MFHATSELCVLILEHYFSNVGKWYQGFLEYAMYCLSLRQGCACNPVSVAWETLLFNCSALKIRCSHSGTIWHRRFCGFTMSQFL